MDFSAEQFHPLSAQMGNGKMLFLSHLFSAELFRSFLRNEKRKLCWGFCFPERDEQENKDVHCRGVFRVLPLVINKRKMGFICEATSCRKRLELRGDFQLGQFHLVSAQLEI